MVKTISLAPIVEHINVISSGDTAVAPDFMHWITLEMVEDITIIPISLYPIDATCTTAILKRIIVTVTRISISLAPWPATTSQLVS